MRSIADSISLSTCSCRKRSKAYKELAQRTTRQKEMEDTALRMEIEKAAMVSCQVICVSSPCFAVADTRVLWCICMIHSLLISYSSLLQGKGRKKRVLKASQNGGRPVYKWKKERKKITQILLNYFSGKIIHVDQKLQCWNNLPWIHQVFRIIGMFYLAHQFQRFSML